MPRMLLIDLVRTGLKLHNGVLSSPRLLPVVVPDRRMTVKAQRDGAIQVRRVRVEKRDLDPDPGLLSA